MLDLNCALGGAEAHKEFLLKRSFYIFDLLVLFVFSDVLILKPLI